MIKARLEDTVFIGLEAANIELLKEGYPIKFALKELGFSNNIEIMVLAKDEDLELLKKTMFEMGAPVTFQGCGDITCTNCVGDNRL